MGQHKYAGRVALPTRWIICTKWAVFDSESTKVAMAAYQALPSVLKEAQKAPEEILTYFWTPIGSPHVYQKKSSIRGVPVSFATEAEAIDGLKKIVNDQPSLTRQDLKFTTLEVRYVPTKVKVYKQDWYNKYVVRESELEFKEHKFIDKIQ